MDFLYNISIAFPAYVVFLYTLLPFLLIIIVNKHTSKFPLSVIFSLSITFSIIFYTCSYFFLRLIGVSIINCESIIYTIPTISIVFLIIHTKLRNFFLKHLIVFFKKLLSIKTVVFVSLLGVYFIILLPYLFSNGYDANGNLHLYDLFSTEVLWHLSISNSFNYDALPKTLHYYETDISSYHFFPNLFLHIFEKLSFCDDLFVLFIYFFVPVLLVILAINIYAFSKIIWKKSSIAFIAVFISLFCYDFSALILWVRAILLEKDFLFGSSWPNYTSVWTPVITHFQLFHNPSFLFSTSLFCGTSIITFLYFKFKNIFWLLLTIAAWIFLIKAKITAFLIGFSALFVFILLKIFTEKQYRELILLVSIIILSYPIMHMSTDQKKNSVEFSSWFFPANFAERIHLISDQEHGQINNNGFADNINANLRFLLAFIIYFVGLLNIRLLIFFDYYIIRKVINWYRQKDIHIFLFAACVSGFSAFIFIVNGLSKYDSLWFFLLTIYILNIYLAKWLYNVISQKNYYKKILTWVTFVLVISTMGAFIIPSIRAYPRNEIKLSPSLVEFYKTIKSFENNNCIMSKYFDLYDLTDEKNQFLVALTGKKVVSEGVGYVFEYREKNQAFLSNLNIIRNDINTFYNTTNSDTAETIINKYNITLVILKKPDYLHFKYSTLLKKIYSNDEMILYQRI